MDTQKSEHIRQRGGTGQGGNGTVAGPISSPAEAPYAPFYHPSPPMDLYDIIKTAFCTVTLLPMRIALILMMMGIYHLALKTVGRGDSPISSLPPLRRRFLEKLAHIELRLGLLILGVRLKVKGQRIPEVHTVVSNHIGYLDMLVYLSLFLPSFVAKKGALTVPFWGMASKRVVECIYVDWNREKPEQYGSASDQIVGFQKKPSQDRALLIFPESTTTNGRALISFRTGAFRAGVPVQPALIRYHWLHFSPSWETIPMYYHFYRFLTQLVHNVEVEYLPPVYPSPQEQANPRLYADRVQQIMGTALGLPCTSHTMAQKTEFHRRIIAGELKWRYWENSQRRELFGLDT